MDAPESPTRWGQTDYAEPASLGSRSGDGARPEVRLWDGPGRRLLQAGCAASALLLAGVLVVALMLQRPGADSPEGAVEQLLQGIADLDGAAIVGVVAPAEVADAKRADDAYSALQERVLREGEVPPTEVDRVLLAAETQLGGSFSRQSLAVLAAVDLDLGGLDLAVERIDDRSVRVYLLDGTLGITVEPDRLPGDAVLEEQNDEPAGYDMALAEGWQRDGEEFVAYLVAVDVDGRWFVSLEASADDLLGTS